MTRVRLTPPIAIVALVGVAFLVLADQAAPTGAKSPSETGQGIPKHDEAYNDSTTLNQNTWGKPELHWVVLADGTGELWKPLCPVGPDGIDKECNIAKYKFRMSDQDLKKFNALAADLRLLAMDGRICPAATDQSYGSVSWTVNDTDVLYRYDMGCSDRLETPGGKAVAAIRRMSELVEANPLLDGNAFETVPSSSLN